MSSIDLLMENRVNGYNIWISLKNSSCLTEKTQLCRYTKYFLGRREKFTYETIGLWSVDRDQRDERETGDGSSKVPFVLWSVTLSRKVSFEGGKRIPKISIGITLYRSSCLIGSVFCFTNQRFSKWIDMVTEYTDHVFTFFFSHTLVKDGSRSWDF